MVFRHVGADADSGLTHKLVTTAANVGDVTQAHALLHGQEQEAYADAGSQGVEKRPENENCAVTWHVAMKRGKRKALPDSRWGKLRDEIEKTKASIHKAQGSEFPAVVIPLTLQHYMMLERNLLYTGVTRGKKLVVVIAQAKALAMAVKNSRSQKRITRLSERLAAAQVAAV